MTRKAPKPLHVYLLSAARKVWYWSPQRREAIRLASVGPDLVRCTGCKKLFPKAPQPVPGKRKKKSLYAVDHVEPVVPVELSFPQIPSTTGSLSWDEYYQRLIFGAQQVLCLCCHKEKTNEENKERRKAKKR